MFKVGDIIRSIPTNAPLSLDDPESKILGNWEGVIVAVRDIGLGEVNYEVKYFDSEATDAPFLFEFEMVKLNDS